MAAAGGPLPVRVPSVGRGWCERYVTTHQPSATSSRCAPRSHPLQRYRGVPRETRFGPLSNARVMAAD
eukprot:2619555-Prymnesium_polylepis.1